MFRYNLDDVAINPHDRRYDFATTVLAGARVNHTLTRVRAGVVAHEHLARAGLPKEVLGKLVRTGWQGEAYQDLFRRQIAQEGR
jgi:hypothetical protein